MRALNFLAVFVSAIVLMIAAEDYFNLVCLGVPTFQGIASHTALAKWQNLVTRLGVSGKTSR